MRPTRSPARPRQCRHSPCCSRHRRTRGPRGSPGRTAAGPYRTRCPSRQCERAAREKGGWVGGRATVEGREVAYLENAFGLGPQAVDGLHLAHEPVAGSNTRNVLRGCHQGRGSGVHRGRVGGCGVQVGQGGGRGKHGQGAQEKRGELAQPQPGQDRQRGRARARALTGLLLLLLCWWWRSCWAAAPKRHVTRWILAAFRGWGGEGHVCQAQQHEQAHGGKDGARHGSPVSRWLWMWCVGVNACGVVCAFPLTSVGAVAVRQLFHLGSHHLHPTTTQSHPRPPFTHPTVRAGKPGGGEPSSDNTRGSQHTVRQGAHSPSLQASLIIPC